MPNTSHQPEPVILLVDDDDTDCEQFRRLSRKEGISDRLAIERNADAALAFLQQRGGHLGMSPTVIVTDLNMPGLNGHEMIEDIRRDPTIENTTIFVFSTSDLDSDIRRAFDAGVAGYFVKEFEKTPAFVSMLKGYLAAARFPWPDEP